MEVNGASPLLYPVALLYIRGGALHAVPLPKGFKPTHHEQVGALHGVPHLEVIAFRAVCVGSHNKYTFCPKPLAFCPKISYICTVVH